MHVTKMRVFGNGKVWEAIKPTFQLELHPVTQNSKKTKTTPYIHFKLILKACVRDNMIIIILI